MANYTHTTLTQFRDKVYQKLGTSSNVYWPATEIDTLLQESLLTFGAISGFWKEEIFIDTYNNFPWYDLFTNYISPVKIGAEHIVPSIKVQTLIDWINRDLIENFADATPTTEFLTLDGIIKSIALKYNLFQQLTTLVLAYYENDVPAQNNTVPLEDGIMDIVRAVFVTTEGQQYVLDQADEEQIFQFTQADLHLSDIPKYYSYLYGSTKDLKLYPTPANTGVIALFYVAGFPNSWFDAGPITADSLIYLPNNLIPYLKYGVLADIFSNDGVWNDPIRAAYCKQRWEEGLIVGKQYNSALIGKVNGLRITIDSMTNLDIYASEDFNFFAAPPTIINPPTIAGFGGVNIFTINVLPKADPVFNLSFLVNANAPIPVNPGDFVKVDMEYINVLADYVVHLAQMKTGAVELAATATLKDAFLKTAIDHNKRLQDRGVTFENLMGKTRMQERDNERIPESSQAQAASTQAQQGY